MPAGKYCSQDLIDDGFLADDDLVQFFSHQLVMLPELFQKLVEVTFFSHVEDIQYWEN